MERGQKLEIGNMTVTVTEHYIAQTLIQGNRLGGVEGCNQTRPRKGANLQRLRRAGRNYPDASSTRSPVTEPPLRAPSAQKL